MENEVGSATQSGGLDLSSLQSEVGSVKQLPVGRRYLFAIVAMRKSNNLTILTFKTLPHPDTPTDLVGAEHEQKFDVVGNPTSRLRMAAILEASDASKGNTAPCVVAVMNVFNGNLFLDGFSRPNPKNVEPHTALIQEWIAEKKVVIPASYQSYSDEAF